MSAQICVLIMKMEKNMAAFENTQKTEKQNDPKCCCKSSDG